MSGRESGQKGKNSAGFCPRMGTAGVRERKSMPRKWIAAIAVALVVFLGWRLSDFLRLGEAVPAFRAVAGVRG